MFSEDMYMLQNAYIMRKHALKKLFEAMSNGSMTEGQRSKIYDHNFDEFLTKPILAEFKHNGLPFLGDCLKSTSGANLPLPTPANFDSSAVDSTRNTSTPFFKPAALDQDEKEEIVLNLFPQNNDIA